MTPELPTMAENATYIMCLENTLIVTCLYDGDSISVARPTCDTSLPAD